MEQQSAEQKKAGSRLTLKQIGWILLLVIWIAGLLLIWIGKAKISNAKKAVEAADARSLQATTIAAEMAWQRVQDGRGLADANDMRGAAQQLQSASELAGLIIVIAPPAKQRLAGEAKSNIDEANSRLLSDKKAVADLLSKAGQTLYELSGKPAGP
jgi:hypothetical protein